MSEPRILVVGSTMMDLIAYAQRLPEVGETLVGDRFQMGFGGKGANQAVMAARFGAPVAMVNAVGSDAYGAAHMENFAKEKINTTWMRTVEGSSGVAPIWVDAKGKNRIIIIPGANNSTDPAVAEEAVREFAPSIVVGELEIPQHVTLAAFRAARAAGITTLLNPAPAAELDPDLLAATDWLAPNETEFATIFGGEPRGDGASARIKAAATTSGTKLIVTLGSAGAVIAIPGEELVNIPAPEAKVVDTTGAGDAFLGAFAFGLASGLTPVEAAKLSVACASASVERLGTQSSYLSRDDAAALAAPYLAKRRT
ncbi:MAG: ribokinase [Candidatus Limnocylindrus sp.]|jgi:ribokinase